MADKGRRSTDLLQILAGEAAEILRVVAASDVEELELEQGGYRIVVRRQLDDVPALALEQPANDAPTSADEFDTTFTIASPVVGWFRRGALIDGPPLADVGQSVEVGAKLAVIEAVQVVHDVVADRAGTIVEILAADGDGVGFGQPLFRLSERIG
ncbi:MAG: biotin/lipoyl-containing protein [Dehalococcoidia bacterium]